jgi:hypothetical protein
MDASQQLKALPKFRKNADAEAKNEPLYYAINQQWNFFPGSV